MRGLARRVAGRGQGDHPLGHDRGAQRRDARGPGLVAQQPVDARRHEPLLPAPDTGLRLAGAPHDLGRAEAIGVSSTIRARQTCFCGLLRSATSASRRRRSDGETAMEIPVRMRQTRMPLTKGNPQPNSVSAGTTSCSEQAAIAVGTGAWKPADVA